MNFPATCICIGRTGCNSNQPLVCTRNTAVGVINSTANQNRLRGNILTEDHSRIGVLIFTGIVLTRNTDIAAVVTGPFHILAFVKIDADLIRLIFANGDFSAFQQGRHNTIGCGYAIGKFQRSVVDLVHFRSIGNRIRQCNSGIRSRVRRCLHRAGGNNLAIVDVIDLDIHFLINGDIILGGADNGGGGAGRNTGEGNGCRCGFLTSSHLNRNAEIGAIIITNNLAVAKLRVTGIRSYARISGQVIVKVIGTIIGSNGSVVGSYIGGFPQFSFIDVGCGTDTVSHKIITLTDLQIEGITCGKRCHYSNRSTGRCGTGNIHSSNTGIFNGGRIFIVAIGMGIGIAGATNGDADIHSLCDSHITAVILSGGHGIDGEMGSGEGEGVGGGIVGAFDGLCDLAIVIDIVSNQSGIIGKDAVQLHDHGSGLHRFFADSEVIGYIGLVSQDIHSLNLGGADHGSTAGDGDIALLCLLFLLGIVGGSRIEGQAHGSGQIELVILHGVIVGIIATAPGIFLVLIEDANGAVSQLRQAGIHKLGVVGGNIYGADLGQTLVRFHGEGKDLAVQTGATGIICRAIGICTGGAGNQDHLLAVNGLGIGNSRQLGVGVGGNGGLDLRSPTGCEAVIHIAQDCIAIAVEKAQSAVGQLHNSSFRGPSDTAVGRAAPGSAIVGGVQEAHKLRTGRASVCIYGEYDSAFGSHQATAGTHQAGHLRGSLDIGDQGRCGPGGTGIGGLGQIQEAGTDNLVGGVGVEQIGGSAIICGDIEVCIHSVAFNRSTVGGVDGIAIQIVAVGDMIISGQQQLAIGIKANIILCELLRGTGNGNSIGVQVAQHIHGVAAYRQRRVDKASRTVVVGIVIVAQVVGEGIVPGIAAVIGTGNDGIDTAVIQCAVPAGIGSGNQIAVCQGHQCGNPETVTITGAPGEGLAGGSAGIRLGAHANFRDFFSCRSISRSQVYH